ncbi:MAG TPA: hypothetical protein VHZ81_15590 [Galbitalea sp.]|jgi:hypothetical protein|nr:hypothetical protein [Galbitalea sp.]
MTKPHLISPPISIVLEEFFAGFRPAASDTMRDRISLARVHLERYLEAEGPNILMPGQRAILNTEREFDPEGAFVRTMRSDDLYYALYHYLDRVHALVGREQRDVQLQMVAELAAKLWREKLVSPRSVSECHVLDFDHALRVAREAVAAAERRDLRL